MRILPFSHCLRLCYKIKRRCDFAIRFAWHTSSTYTLLTPPRRSGISTAEGRTLATQLPGELDILQAV